MIRHFPRRDYNLHPEPDTHIEFLLLNSLIVSFIIPLVTSFLNLIFHSLLSTLAVFARTCLHFALPIASYGYTALLFIFLGLFAHLYGSCYGIHRRDLNPTRRGAEGRRNKVCYRRCLLISLQVHICVTNQRYFEPATLAAFTIYIH